MRWIKHPASFCRSAAMTDVREQCGPAGYGAAWLILERIAEARSGKNAPELRISVKEWSKSCGLSVKKLQDLLEILKSHEIVFSEYADGKLCLNAPILLELQDEWTDRTRKNSGVAPEPLESHSGIQQNRIDKEKKKNRQFTPALGAVLCRHGISPESGRGARIFRHVSARAPDNPPAYLERILQNNPQFDPTETTENSESPQSAGNILRCMGFSQPIERKEP